MALPDDLNQLAQQDVVYLTWVVGPAPTTIFRGRLHQALSGNWVFNTSTGQNGVAGMVLGPLAANWSSVNTPAGGLQVTINNDVDLAGFGRMSRVPWNFGGGPFDRQAAFTVSSLQAAPTFPLKCASSAARSFGRCRWPLTRRNW
jgi:hypothetical protein